MNGINLKVFDIFPEFESDNLHFRELTYDDIVDIFELRGDSRVMEFMDMDPHNDIRDAELMITGIQKDYEDKKALGWAIADKYSDEFLGYFGFWSITPEHSRAKIGYALKPQFWNRGIMSETLSVMILYGFNVMKLHRIEAEVNPYNARSRAVLEKAGFKLDVLLRQNYVFHGKRLDTAVYSILESDFPSAAGSR